MKGSSIKSKDITRTTRMVQKPDTGNVWVNNHNSIQPIVLFQAHKQSGLGVQWGVSDLKGYCDLQQLQSKVP